MLLRDLVDTLIFGTSEVILESDTVATFDKVRCVKLILD